MDLIHIIDEKGNFIGKVFKRKEAIARNLVRNEVVIFILNNNNQILLQKRSSNRKYYPNKWALCTGHVEKDETESEAVIRELREELGIEIIKEEIQKNSDEEWTLRDNEYTHVTYFFSVKIDKKENDFIIQKSELSEVKWYDIDEVINMIVNNNENIIIPEKRLNLLLKLKK